MPPTQVRPDSFTRSARKAQIVAAATDVIAEVGFAQVAPAVEAEDTAAGNLKDYIRSSIGYFGNHRVALTALASLSSTCLLTADVSSSSTWHPTSPNNSRSSIPLPSWPLARV